MKSPKDRNLVLRGKIYYFRKMVGGKVLFRSLKTSSVIVARERRDALMYDDFTWKQVRKVKYVPTVQECIDKFELVAHLRGLKPVTVMGYKSAMRTIIQKGSTYEDFTCPVSVLTREMISRYANAVLDAGNDDARSRRTVGSTIRQARALFSGWAMSEVYHGFLFPDSLTEFLKANPVRSTHYKYNLPDQKLIDDTLNSGQDLIFINFKLYVPYSLCFHIGLRASEAANAKWSDFEKSGDHWKLKVFGKGCKIRYVPVHNRVVGAFFKPDISGYILDGDTHSARLSMVTRSLADWMRSLGWDREKYSKCAHELRKLRGSIWYTTYGAEVAQTWLGHNSVATTCQYYADLTVHPDPLPL